MSVVVGQLSSLEINMAVGSKAIAHTGVHVTECKRKAKHLCTDNEGLKELQRAI